VLFILLNCNQEEIVLKILEPRNLRPYNQDQMALFPPSVQSLIESDDLCMVINDVVKTLDLSCLYKKISTEGNPAYHPAMMLKIYFYAYAKGIFSSRKIAQALKENIAFIFLAAWQKPDFRTIISTKKETQLRGSCDSFVVETDVHYPTDTNLLFDAMRKMISLIAIICSEVGITAWRQSHHNIIKVKRRFFSLMHI